MSSREPGGGPTSLWSQRLSHPARVSELQVEVAALGTHRDRCERVMLGIMRELLQVRARLQQQEAELGALRQEVQRATRAPEEPLEVSGLGRVWLPRTRWHMPQPILPCRTRSRCRLWTRGTSRAQAGRGGGGRPDSPEPLGCNPAGC